MAINKYKVLGYVAGSLYILGKEICTRKKIQERFDKVDNSYSDFLQEQRDLNMLKYFNYFADSPDEVTKKNQDA